MLDPRRSAEKQTGSQIHGNKIKDDGKGKSSELDGGLERGTSESGRAVGEQNNPMQRVDVASLWRPVGKQLELLKVAFEGGVVE